MAVSKITEVQAGSTGRRRITILGATGSIGTSTADLVARNPDTFDVAVLTANRNVADLAALARDLRPDIAIVADDASYNDLKDALADTGIEVAAGSDALVAAAREPVDMTVAGIVGAAGLDATLAAIQQGSVVALANKECLVCAGDLVLEECAQSGATLLPLDSEHNAIFQVFETENADDVEKLILTASGGPFRTWTQEQMAGATPDQAVAHPNWDMGRKISVDSATMMNKGLELIEAAYLFPVDSQDIDVLVHPQSVVHSMVAYTDGSILAQLGPPDMRVPIAHALAWPARMKTPVERLDLAAIGSLNFELPDNERFPAIALARHALELGNGSTAVLNAANEIAVQSFLDNLIGFLDIAKLVEKALDQVVARPVQTLNDFRDLDTETRAVTESLVKLVS
ncbi:MAG: 1-deoxy-D-xylulose-5-phosphate reductoisomerase [Alphaproteobacteria bacterium]|nr:1-deoxy-D-xylulose-5-phosphate reductoisomerase [Alphaproteobacteria bacterium]